jgi:hypothetical protein
MKGAGPDSCALTTTMDRHSLSGTTCTMENQVPSIKYQVSSIKYQVSSTSTCNTALLRHLLLCSSQTFLAATPVCITEPCIENCCTRSHIKKITRLKSQSIVPKGHLLRRRFAKQKCQTVAIDFVYVNH